MANQSGRPIAPARKLVAAVLGTIAAFVMVFGLGLSSWAIVVLGLAMLALSIALGMVNVVRRGARAWVSGTAQVKAISDAPVSSAYGRAELQVVVVAPGLPVTEVLIRDPRVPVDKWPRLGETLPITVDVDDMRRVRIDWPNAPDRADPPPPGASYNEPAYDPAYTDPLDEYDDDLLGEPEPPPWNPGMQWRPEPDEPPPPPPASPAPPPPAAETEPLGHTVVVHDTPAGPILEGQFVDHAAAPPPLPRRSPIPAPSGPAFAASGPVSAPSGPAFAASGPRSDSPRPPGTRPSPRPRSGASAGAATATVDPETATSADRSPQINPDGTDAASSEAAPTTAPTAPEQRPVPDEPLAARVDDEIDLPLDGDPEPPPEYSAAARTAVAEGLVAPPPADVPHFVPPPREEPIPDPAADSPGPWDDLGAAAYQPDERADEVITAYPSARPGAAGAIHGVGLTVLVTNLERSIKFYRDTLGFFEIDKGEGNAVLASGDTRLVLRTVTDLTSAGRLIYLNLEVGDVEGVYRELVAKGVVFEHEPMVVNHGEKLELWSATFHDPDGHNIAITQWRSAGPS